MLNDAADQIRDAVKGIFMDKKTLVRILSVGLILLIAAALKIHDSHSADITVETAGNEEEYEQTAGEEESAPVIFVDIGGAVNAPGVYQVSQGTRLFEVIDMAGGLTEDADADSVNRASFVEDGQKIIIPEMGEGGGGVQSSALPADNAGAGGLININTASPDELKTLNGIGDVLAERIIEYRSEHAFKSKEDIMSVNGIGTKLFEKIKDRITC